MQETTIDFGIDLGTTNSVIALMNAGQIEVIKNGNSELTPSCVYVNKKGVSQIGAAAALRLGDARSTLDVHSEVKRLMGQRVDLKFESTGHSMSPEQVSAEILKEIRKAAEVRFGHMPRAAIITIPAMFETPQREATARAAKLAGFDHYELLQEPVAAAVAYGFRADAQKAFWLVYDFGGGTFDAAIVAVRDGQLAVVDHDGDNYLGGCDFDWAIVEHVLIPKLQEKYNFPNLSRESMKSNAAIRAAMFRLKNRAEQLKFELSRSEQAHLTIEETTFQDESGESIDLDVTLTRDKFNELIEGMVDESIRIVERLLKSSKLAASDIHNVLLVGGSTFVPCIRERVKALGISVDCTLDPMTVVARGAAIYAASQRLPEKLGEVALKSGGAHLKLEYTPVSKDINPLVGGRIALNSGETLAQGTTIEIKRSDAGWSSGSIPLEGSGMFFTNLMVVENQSCSFTVTVRDPQNCIIPVSPNSFTITHGLSVAKATLPGSIRLAKYDGTTDLLLKKGTPLPASIDGHRVHTTKALAKDNAKDELHIPFVEGDEEQSARNRVGSRIIIRGDEVHRSLPENTELEITAEVDKSMVVRFRVFVPLLDEHFECDINERASTELKHEPADVMENRLGAAMSRLQDFEEKANQVDDGDAQMRLKSLQLTQQISAIRGNIAAWKGGDHSAAGRVRNQQLELDKELDEIEGLVEWPAFLAKYRGTLDRTRKIIHQEGNTKAQNALSRLEREGSRAIEDHDLKMLKATHGEIASIQMAIVTQDPSFWVGMLHHVAENIQVIPNQAKAHALIQEGMQAIDHRDLMTLESVVKQLLKMMPSVDAERIQAIRSDVR